MPYDVLMVSRRMPGTAEEIVYVWLKNPDFRRLFPGFDPSVKPPALPRPGLLAGEVGVFEQFFPKA